MKLQKKVVSLIFSLLLIIVFNSVAGAQTSPIAIENMPRVFGVGVGILPDYVGSDDYIVGAAPFGRYNFGKTNRYLELIATELSANVLNHPYWRLGPAANYRFGRDDVADAVVDKMEKIDDTVELGVIGGVEFISKTEPRKRFIALAEFLHDVAGGYDGYLVSLNARFWYPLLKVLDFTFGAGATYGSDNYMSTYFGVSQNDSQRSGLPVYDADGGIRDFQITPGIVIHFSYNWHLGIGLRYQRLLSDAADSPVVDDRGSANQFITGLALAYSW